MEKLEDDRRAGKALGKARGKGAATAAPLWFPFGIG